MTPPAPDSSPPIRSWQLVALFLIGLCLRVTGLMSYENGDEGWSAAAQVLVGELKGGTSQTLPLINYLIAASFVALFGLGRLLGAWHGPAEFRTLYFTDLTPFMVAGRLVTGSLGALTAPLATLIARRLGLGRNASLLVGLMAALYPLNTWTSHFAKSDSGVALGVLLLAWAILRKLDTPDSWVNDALVGFGMAVAVAFKQTSLLVVAPLSLAYVLLLRYDVGRRSGQIVSDLALTAVVGTAAWAPMSLGVLLDIPSFLSYQRSTQALMSTDTTLWQSIWVTRGLMYGGVEGLTVVGLVCWLAFPLLYRKPRGLALWASTLAAYLVFAQVSGGLKVQSRYLLPYHALSFVLACVAALSLTRSPRAFARAVGVVLALGLLVGEAASLRDVVGQSLAPPMDRRCSQALRRLCDSERDRILVSGPQLVDLPVDPSAGEEDYARHEALARKYNVVLPPRAPERLDTSGQTQGDFFIRRIPFAMGGMEDLDPAVSDQYVQPFWWPIQPEEWHLDYWLDCGFSVFVVENQDIFETSTIPAYASLHREIRERCELLEVLPSSRKLYDEGEVRIYRAPASASHAADRRTAPPP